MQKHKLEFATNLEYVTIITIVKLLEMKKLIFSLALAVASVTVAQAYEHTFNWNDYADRLPKQLYTEIEVPTSGINIFVHVEGTQIPNVHAWNNNSFSTTWPGIQPEGDVKYVSSNDNEGEKKSYYLYHFDSDNLKIIVNNNGDNDKSAETIISKPGSYFFDYSGVLGSQLTAATKYYKNTGGNNVNIHVKIMNGKSFTPTVYCWNRYYTPSYGQTDSHKEMNNDGNWWNYTLTTDNILNGGIIISDHGNNDSKTTDITGLTPGDHYFYYYPYNGKNDDRYEKVMFAGESNFKMWDYNPSREVSFTSTDGMATMTIYCQSEDDVAKVLVKNGELQFPRYSKIEFTTLDGYNINKVMLGEPTQGNKTYTFNDVKYKNSDYIKDMGAMNDAIKLIVNTNGSNTLNLGEVINWNETYFLSNKVMVCSEQTTLEDLVNAQHSVRKLNWAINHDVVGVGVRKINGTDMLIARSVDHVKNMYPIKEGQEILLDSNAKPYEWSNPETPQYAWIAIELPSGSKPADYVGKQLSGMRGMFCGNVDDGTNHVAWHNPCIKLESAISESQIKATGVETHLITYSIACLTNQGDEHTFKGNRETDKGSESYEVSGKYYLLRPHQCEICNVVDVMRTDDEVLWIPDTRAVMPTVNEDGKDIVKPNIYTQNGIVGYANIQAGYVTGANSIWAKADEIGLKDYPGQAWRMRYKVYDVPEAFLIASDFHLNDYPLVTPNPDYDTELSRDKDGNLQLGMHIMGSAVLAKYDNDILVSNSDYWSRYNYGEDKNAYRNDLHIAINTLSKKFHTLGDLIVERLDQNDLHPVTIATITCTESSDNNVKYTVKYEKVAEEASNDEELEKITPKADFSKTEFIIGEGKDKDKYITISDMFYSSDMSNKEHNTELNSAYYYHVRPAKNQETTEVAGYAPIYKTDETVATRASYSKDEVDADTENTLANSDKVEVNFKPNTMTAVTSYRVLGAAKDNYVPAQKAEKDAKSLVINDDTHFLTQPIEVNEQVNTAMVYVPEVYTAYNDNTYGCYKQSVSDAEIILGVPMMQVSERYARLANGNPDYTKPLNIIYGNARLDLTSTLYDTEKDARYMVRVWRKVSKDDNVISYTLLNGQDEFGTNDADAAEFLAMYGNWNSSFAQLNDAVSAMNDNDNQSASFNDSFKIDLNESNAGNAPRRADRPEGLSPIADGVKVTYDVALYVQDVATGMYYKKITQIEKELNGNDVITAIDDVQASQAPVASVRYVNASGMMSNEPFNGVNMVITTHTDGTVTTSKMIR